MDSNEERIEEAFENPKYNWRTIRGVSKETGLSGEVIAIYITRHGDRIVKSLIRNSKGETLYTTRKKYKEKTNIFTRLSSVMKNRGG